MRPINTLKHTIDSQQSIPAGTATNITLASAAESAESTIAVQTDIGSKISSIFLNVQVVNSTNAVGAINNAYMFVYGNPGNNVPTSSIPDVNEVGISNFRKMVFHQDMAMLSDANDSIPITLFKGVLKVPRKFQRQGVGDRLVVKVGTPTGGAELDACVQCIYKEIR